MICKHIIKKYNYCFLYRSDLLYSSDMSLVIVTNTLGYCSHAECIDTEAKGNGSHAEGNVTKALGKYSHAEGEDTNALCFIYFKINKYDELLFH